MNQPLLLHQILAPKLSLSQSHFEDDSSPYISWSGLPIWIHHTFVLFKDVTLTWINYFETWLRSDNTSCYYISVKWFDTFKKFYSIVLLLPFSVKVLFFNLFWARVQPQDGQICNPNFRKFAPKCWRNLKTVRI